MPPDFKELQSALIIGIDLGTTKSGISAWKDDLQRPALLPDAQKRELTPSVIGWDIEQKRWLVGHAARELGQRAPGNIVYSIKRYIGRWFNDPNVLYGQRDLPYKLVSGGGKDQLTDVQVELDLPPAVRPERLSAPAVSAEVLKKLRQDAALALGVSLEEVKYAVITVPAYFNVLQRRATSLAGDLAGLTVAGILNEPTAAALAYGRTVDGLLGPIQKRILVFDLGGGTFDISLLDAVHDDSGYAFNTRIVDGDTHLGGDDIDASVVRWLIDEIETQTGHKIRPDDFISRERLRQAAEGAKRLLSDVDSAVVGVPGLDSGEGQLFDVRISLTRAQLELCAQEVIQKALAITKRAVEQVAGLKWADIDEVILVGGQTLMPLIQREVEALTLHKPRVNDRPQQIVALGAGEYAHILSQGEAKFHENFLSNVIALPLGIRLDDNRFQTLVEANTTLPCESKPYFATTTEDEQTTICVDILQGPRNTDQADQCVLLGSIEMEVLPAPARTPRFAIRLQVQANGTMVVEVKDERRNVTETRDIIETRTTILRDDQQLTSGETAP